MKSYDDIPYPSLVYSDTHPNKLATLATLFGLHPPSVINCRILELGCGDGTNLIAIAQTLPQAQCYGVDFSERQIQTGQSVIATIGLTNITLKHLNFNELDESLGQFDYIIAHGVYSWINAEGRDNLLRLIQQRLTSHGIAYVSYNVYPGWHNENMLRDLMIYHTQQLAEVPFPIYMRQAKGILQFLAYIRQNGDTAFDKWLQEKWQELQHASDNYLYHDFLEAENHPVYVQQFIYHAKQHDLAYVTDIEFRHYLLHSLPPSVAEAMVELFQGDFIKKEQYMDFFYNRTLRRTLLCHQQWHVQRELGSEPIMQCYFTAIPTSSSTESTPFTAEFKKQLSPMTIAALTQLIQCHPLPLNFEELFNRTSQQTMSRKQFAEELAQLYALELIELSLIPPVFVTQLSTYPTASPLARFYASRQQQPIINLRGEFVQLDEITTILLPYLDGTNTTQQLRHILKKLLKQHKIFQMDSSISERKLSQLLETALTTMTRQALLIH
jgi:methyltransferase-like protein/ubiquinone/menaquinone biosynthesis C-methylase UbiE